jgi:hypothetical protein
VLILHSLEEYGSPWKCVVSVRGQTRLLTPPQALVDDGTKKSRYSFLKSAATIALLSVAVGAVAATAGAALLPEAAALEAVSEIEPSCLCLAPYLRSPLLWWSCSGDYRTTCDICDRYVPRRVSDFIATSMLTLPDRSGVGRRVILRKGHDGDQDGVAEEFHHHRKAM